MIEGIIFLLELIFLCIFLFKSSKYKSLTSNEDLGIFSYKKK
jgi:hypothetical protein